MSGIYTECSDCGGLVYADEARSSGLCEECERERVEEEELEGRAWEGAWLMAWSHAFPNEMALADARLIAAAPDLLTALKRLSAEVQDEAMGRLYMCDGVGTALEGALAAIAKAEGRTT